EMVRRAHRRRLWFQRAGVVVLVLAVVSLLGVAFVYRWPPGWFTPARKIGPIQAGVEDQVAVRDALGRLLKPRQRTVEMVLKLQRISGEIEDIGRGAIREEDIDPVRSNCCFS